MKIGYFSTTFYILRNKLMLCLSIPIPGFPNFYYVLCANVGSFLHGDVSVMYQCLVRSRLEEYHIEEGAILLWIIWAAPSEFGTYRLCEQRRFRRACASAQSRQNLRCSLIQAVSPEEPSDRKPDPWPLWMAGHAQLKFVMTECSKTQIRLAGLI